MFYILQNFAQDNVHFLTLYGLWKCKSKLLKFHYGCASYTYINICVNEYKICPKNIIFPNCRHQRLATSNNVWKMLIYYAQCRCCSRGWGQLVGFPTLPYPVYGARVLIYLINLGLTWSFIYKSLLSGLSGKESIPQSWLVKLQVLRKLEF